MLTEIERPSQFRVLMRVPRLRHQLAASDSPAPASQPDPETAPPVLEYEVTEVTQQVAEDIAMVQGRRWLRPVVVAQVLVVLLAVAIALLSRQGGTPAPDASDPTLEIPTVTLPAISEGSPGGLPEADRGAALANGGSPVEITSAPELTLPDGPAASIDPLTTIERLPPVSLESPTFTPMESVSSATTHSTGQETPGVARLDRRIETPKPDAQYDSSRPGLY